MIKQISVFIENKPGRLAEVTGLLSEAGINIHALSIADTTDFGILRMIVSECDKAKKVLKDNGLTVRMTDVVAVAVNDSVGSLHDILVQLEKADIAIEYMYAFTSRSPKHEAMIILRLANQDEVYPRLKNLNIHVAKEELLDLLGE